MYILFYPLKFPSTPVLILLKSCNTTAIFLWPRTGVEPAFTRQHREYCRTCAYSVSNLWQFRESVIPHCWITYITHLPKSLGATLPFVHRDLNPDHAAWQAGIVTIQPYDLNVFFCTATGIQIRVAGMKIQDPNQLDDRRMCKAFCFFSSGRGIRTLDFQAMKSEELPLLYPAMLF